MTVIDYRPGIPPEVRGAIEPLLTCWQGVLPSWCHTLNVIWSEADTGALSIRTQYEYRRATLTVYPNFITCPDKRERDVIHELMHVLLEPLANVMTDMRDELAEKCPDVKRWAEEAARYGEESAVCDLAAAFLRLGSGLDSARTVG